MTFSTMVQSVRSRTRHLVWVFGALLLLSGCNTLKPDKNYAVYYYSPMDKVVQVEFLKAPHTRSAKKPPSTVPALADVCDPSYPSMPSTCQGNFCPVSVMATYAIYYGEGDTLNDPVKVVGIERGSFVGRSAEWPTGGGCQGACSKKCSAPSAGGIICIC